MESEAEEFQLFPTGQEEEEGGHVQEGRQRRRRSDHHREQERRRRRRQAQGARRRQQSVQGKSQGLAHERCPCLTQWLSLAVINVSLTFSRT